MNQPFFRLWQSVSIVVNDIVCVLSCFVDTVKMTGAHTANIQINVHKVQAQAKHTGTPMIKTNIQSERPAGVPHPGRQSPQTASDLAVPASATPRPRISQEACGRQSSESNVSEKVPVGHNWHFTSSVGLCWVRPQAWKERRSRI